MDRLVIQLNPGGVSHILARPFAENGTATLRYYTMRLLHHGGLQRSHSG